MAKIPFDVKFRPQIESGEYKVETRDGRPVRIICWDRQHEDYPLIVLVSCKEGEDCEVYTIDGKFFLNQELSAHDLIIITPEPELTEFEKELATVVGFAISQSVVEPNEDIFKFVKNWSERLLDLARKQLIEEQYTSDHRKTSLYKLGKADALKDLPRWKKCAPCDEDKSPIPTWIVRFDAELAGESAVVHNGHYILFGDLEKLPKED